MIKTNEIFKETISLMEILDEKRLIDKKTSKKLEEKGFYLMSLGTGQYNYTFSRDITIIDCRRNRVYYNDKLFFVVGVSNEKYGKGKLYRGYVKEIKDSENLTDEDIKILKKIIEDARKEYNKKI